jgi:hypothetical protein
MQYTTETPKQYQCRHIFTDGHRCASPCLRREEFCYYHHTTRRPVANPRQRRSRRSTFHLPLPEDRSAIQSSIGQVLQRIAANEIDHHRAGLLLYGLQIASLNLPKIQPAKTAESQTVSQTVEEITIDPTLGVLAPRTEVSDIAKRKSPVAQLIERMMQKEEKPVPTPEPATIPTLQACSSPLNPTQPRQMSFRPERSAVEKSASPPHLPPPHSACAAAGPPPRNAKKRLPAQTQKTSFRPKAAHLPPHWRNPLLQLNLPASAPSLRKKSAFCSFG